MQAHISAALEEDEEEVILDEARQQANSNARLWLAYVGFLFFSNKFFSGNSEFHPCRALHWLLIGPWPNNVSVIHKLSLWHHDDVRSISVAIFCHLGGYMTSSCLAYSWVRVTPGWMEKSEAVLYRFWLGTGPMSKARLLLKWQQWLWKRALVRSSVCCCKSLRRQKQNQGSSPLSWLTKKIAASWTLHQGTTWNYTVSVAWEERMLWPCCCFEWLPRERHSRLEMRLCNIFKLT